MAFAHSKIELGLISAPWPNRPLVIALHSPSALLETGLRVGPPEKR
jgi:hypothetical protein